MSSSSFTFMGMDEQLAQGRRYARFDLRYGPGRAQLVCSGELDWIEGVRLEAVLARLESHPVRVSVDLADVSFCDSFGLAPLFETSRRRSSGRLPALELTEVSGCVTRLLGLLDVRSVAPLDITAWDAAALVWRWN